VLTQLQLEGPELEPLLARVRSELGPHARVVHAEKVRSGGVAGFFARERFELTVEVDTSRPGTPPAVPVAEPSASAAALGSDEPEHSLLPSLSGLTAPAPARTAAAAAHAYAPQAAAPVLPPVPEPLEELPTVVAAALRGRSSAPPPPRAPRDGTAVIDTAPAAFTPYAAFAEVVDATAAPAAVDTPSSVLELADRVSAEEVEAVVSTETSSFAALLSRLGDDIGALADEVSDHVDAAPALLSGPAGPRSADTGAVAVCPPAGLVVPEAADAQEGPAAELARLGLPCHLRPSGVGEALHTALRASLSRLPTAPPAMNRAGGVLAVVGPLAHALPVAREIAEELGLPAATSVAVATAGTPAPDVAERQVLHGAAEAAQRRSTWRRRSTLTVVAVDAPLTASGAAGARDLLAALSPTATWGVVEATRKAQDVGSWTRALGGVHALALTELEETSDPAAVLELGIPVSRLGGRPATPRAWATLLTGRLAA
jgi:hypothetical protein